MLDHPHPRAIFGNEHEDTQDYNAQAACSNEIFQEYLDSHPDRKQIWDDFNRDLRGPDESMKPEPEPVGQSASDEGEQPLNGEHPGEPDEQPADEKPDKKKRPFLKDMTPNSKAAELERRKQLKRDSSLAWHKSWKSKGVPKDAAPPQNAEDPPAEEPKDPVAPPIEDDGFQADPEILGKAIKSDMRSVRSNFMNQWIEWKKTQPDSDGDMEKLRKEAADKWLKSELRAQMSAGRLGKQFWTQ